MYYDGGRFFWNASFVNTYKFWQFHHFTVPHYFTRYLFGSVEEHVLYGGIASKFGIAA
jgi:hypothetical protein